LFVLLLPDGGDRIMYLFWR